MKTTLLGLIAFLFLLSACNSTDTSDASENQSDSTEVANNAAPEPEADATETSSSDEGRQQEQTKTVKGTIQAATIDPYPMGSLTFVTEQGETLNLYFEGVSSEMEQLPNRVGEQATITYRVENQKAVMDVLLGDETLMGDIDHSSDWKMVEGVLIAKEENMGGDLPGFFEIQLADGTTESFEAFLTDAMVSHSGKSVYVFYDARKTLVLENVQ